MARRWHDLLAQPDICRQCTGSVHGGWWPVNPSERVDVVVVGAGLSGLSCALELQRAGLRVRLLEARQRCGGRMQARHGPAGMRLELGGQWVGASHHRLIQLLGERGLRRFPSWYEGEGIFHWNGRPHRAGIDHAFRDSLLFFRPVELQQLPTQELARALALQSEFGALVDQLDPAAPWSHPEASRLDGSSLATWLVRRGASELEAYPLAWLARMGGSGGFEPEESSLLHLAWTQAVAPQHETPEAWLVQGGISQLAAAMAAELEGALRLDAPVEALTQEGGAVRVQWGGGAQTRAAAAVVAIPPPLRLGIRFDPPLPPEQVALLQRSPMGAMVKMLAVYRCPFWRQQGLNGLGIGNLPLLELTADCSPPEGPGLLVGFIAADRARRWRSLGEPQRRRAVLADLVSLWGTEAGDPLDLVQHDWCAEPWSGGAFTSFLVPGAWSRFGRHWQAPHGRVIWAGTEVASRWPGYFEGALEAGGSAASQVRCLLGGGAPDQV